MHPKITKPTMMNDKEILRIVELVMYFVRTRRNAGSATNNEVFMYVKQKIKERL